MIKIEQGPEYMGETYIWCDICSPEFNGQSYYYMGSMTGVFEGTSLDELSNFIYTHAH